MRRQSCDQCCASMINGVFCHEHGCPNRGKIYDADSLTWKSERDFEPEEDDEYQTAAEEDEWL